MIEVNGKYAKAKIFNDIVEETAMKQVYGLVNSPVAKDSKVRFMSDIHAGAGCVIGTTMTIKDRVCPNLVGVDINCGVAVYELGSINNFGNKFSDKNLEDSDYKLFLEELDTFITNNIPNGREVRTDSKHFLPRLKELKCIKYINLERANNSIGSLGGKR